MANITSLCASASTSKAIAEDANAVRAAIVWVYFFIFVNKIIMETLIRGISYEEKIPLVTPRLFNTNLNY